MNNVQLPLHSLYQLTPMETRSVCPENKTGAKGRGGMANIGEGIASHAARELGRGWKVDPYIFLEPGETATLMDVTGPGVVQHIWMTCTGSWRNLILRMTWDGAGRPSVEAPVGDFFACGWGQYAHVNSLAVCVNPGSAFNSYWPMPFRRAALVTLENRGTERAVIYYQITYALTALPEDAGYFHAQFRRVNPLPYQEVYTVLDGIAGTGRYVGTYMAWGVNNSGWWGEGEIKFYIDGDRDFPTVCGTGTEDYYCGSYNFENRESRAYQPYTTAYAGLPQVIKPDGVYKSQTRFGMYRWHLPDPICFQKDLRVTIQALGWRSGGRYRPLQDDMASVAYWYQDAPFGDFPALPDVDYLEII